jgi:hypothetical protein
MPDDRSGMGGTGLGLKNRNQAPDPRHVGESELSLKS